MLKIALFVNILLSFSGFFSFAAIVVSHYLTPPPNGLEHSYAPVYWFWTVFIMLFLTVNFPIAKRVADKCISHYFLYYLYTGLIVAFPYLIQYAG